MKVHNSIVAFFGLIFIGLIVLSICFAHGKDCKPESKLHVDKDALLVDNNKLTEYSKDSEIVKELGNQLSEITLLDQEDMLFMYTTFQEFDAVCNAYNIKYWMCGGSMFVILRKHKTHLPWDDDYDINMTTEDASKITEPEVLQTFRDMNFIIITTQCCHRFIKPRAFNISCVIEVFIVEENGDELFHPFLKNHPLNHSYGIHTWKKAHVYPLKRVEYGPIEVWSAANVEEHLKLRKTRSHIDPNTIYDIIVWNPHTKDRGRVSNIVRNHFGSIQLDAKRVFEKYDNMLPEFKRQTTSMRIVPTTDQWNDWMTCFFTFQWVPDKTLTMPHFWNPKYFIERDECPRDRIVNNGKEAVEALKKLVDIRCEKYKADEIGILISSGIDSGTVAYSMPENSHAFFVKYVDLETSETDELPRRYAEENNLQFHVVEVTWYHYVRYTQELINHKKAPLHPSEVALYVVFKQAKKMGIKLMLAGWGCDTYFGGMDKLIQNDFHTTAEFEKRFTYLDPDLILDKPNKTLTRKFFDKYDGIPYQTQNFLNDNYHGMTMQCFFYISDIFDIDFYCPWGNIGLPNDTYDLARVRNGEPKYIITEAFKILAPDLQIPDKIPFTRPDYIKYPENIECRLFKNNIDYKALKPQHKWMMFMAASFYEEVTKRPNTSQYFLATFSAGEKGIHQIVPTEQMKKWDIY